MPALQTEKALLAAERQGRTLVAAARPVSGQAWEIDVGEGPDALALMVAGRWAARLGAAVRLRLPASREDGDVWQILARGSRLQNLVAPAPATARNRLRIRNAGGEEITPDIADANEGWRLSLSDSGSMVARAASALSVMTCAQCRRVDQKAIDDYGVPGICLMENAAMAAVTVAADLAPGKAVLVAAGGGNNGGDGLALARGMRALGVPATVAMLKPPAGLAGDAAINYRLLEEFPDIPVLDIHDRPAELSALARDHGLVVDALLGTGFRGSLSPVFREAIAAVNAAGKPVLALDIPSGLDGDNGEVAEAAVRATRCVTFAAVKNGLITAAGPEHCGELYLGDIGAPSPALVV